MLKLENEWLIIFIFYTIQEKISFGRLLTNNDSTLRYNLLLMILKHIKVYISEFITARIPINHQELSQKINLEKCKHVYIFIQTIACGDFVTYKDTI